MYVELDLNFFRDQMHIVYLGFARDLLASIIVDRMLEAGVAPQGRQKYLQQLTISMNKWLTLHHRGKAVRRTFTWANIGADGACYPELSGMFKASAIKAMVFYFAYVCKDDCTERGKLRATCMWALADYVYRCGRHGLFIAYHDRRVLMSRGRLHLVTYYMLAHHAADRSERLYKIRPKHHAFDELLSSLLKSCLNPDRFSTWTDEDYLGKLKRIACRCHGSSVLSRCLQRYMLNCSLRFATRRRRGRWLCVKSAVAFHGG